MSASKNIQKAKKKRLNRLIKTDFYKAVAKREQDKIGEVGRPLKITTNTLHKLFEAFMIGSDDEGACFWANISKSLLYEFQQEFPEFVELKEQCKENPIMKARNTIYQNLSNPDYAFRFLERKKKAEFAIRSEITGADGEKLFSETIESLNNNVNLADRITKIIDEQSVATNPPIQDQK